ncbi:hypothetical protein DFJ63DRAFT_311241 [Scheffersomyces coipomensis]|uniref:uncharacterized protein n=1 Tax=Scheffersomyces coipomensis TaxID=1788519 RepID=UPI00315C4F49
MKVNATVWYLVLSQAFLNVAAAAAVMVTPNHQSILRDQPILQVSTKTHDRQLIYDKLQQSYQRLFGLNSNHHAVLHLSNSDSINNERSCLENSNIKYYLKNVQLVNQDFEASECRTNLNNQYQSILQPTFNVHQFVHFSSTDQIMNQLQSNLIVEFAHHDKLQQFKFFQFQDLNYDLQCLVDYNQLMQVKLRENLLEANLEIVIEVADTCGFQKINDSFDGIVLESLKINIPINGTFYCHNGRSSTCTRVNANYKNSRFKLIS